LPPVKIPYGILQNTLKQERQFFQWFGGIFFNQFRHRILNNIQRQMFVSYREQCLFIRAPFDFS
jgi:hypothetical protein